MLFGNSSKRCGIKQAAALPDWRIGHDGHLVLPAPGQKIVFNAAMFGVVEHLVGGAGVSAGNSEEFRHIVYVEIRNSPGADLALLLQFLEGFDRVPERIATAPVKQIEVNGF